MNRNSQPEITYIYGKHAVSEAARLRPDIFKDLYLDPEFRDQEFLYKLKKLTLGPKPLDERKLPGGLSRDAVHQGVVAGIKVNKLVREYKEFMEVETLTNDSAVLILGEVQDPHNVGAAIRSAAAFGLRAVMIPPHNQAPITGTVIKVSAGMAFRVPLVTIRNVNATIADLQKRGFWVYGLAGEDNSVPLTTEQFTKPSAFVLGNEASGLREKTREACDTLLSIPMHPRCESLNAAAATAVTLFAWSAQHPGALK